MALRIDDVDLERDRSLVERAQLGDGAAFAELYARYFARLCRFCERRVGNKHEAEEVAQEAFTRAYRALGGFDGERRFYPWLSVIASRLCVDVHRRRSRSQPSADVDAGWVDGGQEDVLRTVDRDRVRLAMARLSTRHQEILRLREWEGWSYQQLAEHLDMTMAGTEALLWRARQALRREIERLDSGGGRWAAIPVIGWLTRRLAGLRHGTTAALSHSLAPLIGSALSAAMIGAMALGGASAPSRPDPVPSVQLRAGAAASSLPPPGPAAAATGDASGASATDSTVAPAPAGSPASSPAAQPASYHPVAGAQLSRAAPAAQGASQQPVGAGLAGTQAGADPVQPLTDLATQAKSTIVIRRLP